MSFGGGTKTQNVTQTSKQEIPEWVKQAGQSIFEVAKGTAARPYPVYGDERIVGFSPEQLASFDITESSLGSYRPSFMNAFFGAGEAARPIDAGDISRYMNPFTSEVVGRSIDDMNRQFNRDTIARHASMAHRGSYLNEDRRDVIDQLAREALSRNVGSVSANAYAGAFNDAISQANRERDRDLSSATLFSNLGPSVQSMGLRDAAALSGVGEQTRDLAQQGTSLRYEDFLREFAYPQGQLNFLNSTLAGVPYENSRTTTGQQLVPQANPFSSVLGALSLGAGLFGNPFSGLLGGGSAATAASSSPGLGPGYQSFG